jgi:hypothetical protein
MAMTLTTVKNTNNETVIHFTSGAAETGTITIANIAAATQARNSDAPQVNIVKFMCTGELSSKITISRNSKIVIVTAPENDINVEFNALGIPVNNDNTYDIAIINGAAKEVSGWLVLHKIKGWSSKIETATFGSYDNESVVGS